MAYGIFTSRKLYLTDYIFNLQTQLENIMDQKQKLLNFSANIADGVISVEDIANDPTNTANYAQYLQEYEAWTTTSDAEGGCGTTIGQIAGQASDQSNGDDNYILSIKELLNKSIGQEFARIKQKQLNALENQLDLKQKKIETKLTAAQKDLESTEEAEKNAIDRATPKYSGLG